ncbi:MAG TPA: glycosidase, partial [Bacteroidota bacterium]
DFEHFRVRSLSGKAAKNKGMALFPRTINGKYTMVSRQDGENLYIVQSNEIYRWRQPGALLQPTFPWEFTQIGNCGSPIETDKGWILLTHGVGPVRRYCIGAILLDRNDPSKVIGRLRDPLIAPDETEREGYVPNVVYTCGALSHNGKLIIPYAMSDYATRIATVDIAELLTAMHTS